MVGAKSERRVSWPYHELEEFYELSQEYPRWSCSLHDSVGALRSVSRNLGSILCPDCDTAASPAAAVVYRGRFHAVDFLGGHTLSSSSMGSIAAWRARIWNRLPLDGQESRKPACWLLEEACFSLQRAFGGLYARTSFQHFSEPTTSPPSWIGKHWGAFAGVTYTIGTDERAHCCSPSTTLTPQLRRKTMALVKEASQ
jgi:hypothetical protein